MGCQCSKADVIDPSAVGAVRPRAKEEVHTADHSQAKRPSGAKAGAEAGAGTEAGAEVAVQEDEASTNDAGSEASWPFSSPPESGCPSEGGADLEALSDSGRAEAGDEAGAAAEAGEAEQPSGVARSVAPRGFTAEAAQLLEVLDANSDSRLNSAEFRMGVYSGVLELAASEHAGAALRGFTAEAAQLLEALDANSDAHLSTAEFRMGVYSGVLEFSTNAHASTVSRGFTAEAAQLLEALDANNDACLSTGEFRKGVYSGVLELADDGAANQPSEGHPRGFTAEAAQLLRALDMDSDSRLGRNEFRRGVDLGALDVTGQADKADNGESPCFLNLMRGCTAEARELLEALDVSKDGCLDIEELKTGVRTGAVSVAADEKEPSSHPLMSLLRGFTAEAVGLLQELDANKDGGLNIDEFLAGIEAGSINRGAAEEEEGAVQPSMSLLRSLTAEAFGLLSALDTNSDGRVGRAELQRGVQLGTVEVPEAGSTVAERAAAQVAAGGQAPPKKCEQVCAEPRPVNAQRGFTTEASQLVKALDTNSDGCLNSAEFQDGVRSGAVAAKSAGERQADAALKRLLRGFSAEAAQLLQALDANQSGTVSLAEFRAGMQKRMMEVGPSCDDGQPSGNVHAKRGARRPALAKASRPRAAPARPGSSGGSGSRTASSLTSSVDGSRTSSLMSIAEEAAPATPAGPGEEAAPGPQKKQAGKKRSASKAAPKKPRPSRAATAAGLTREGV